MPYLPLACEPTLAHSTSRSRANQRSLTGSDSLPVEFGPPPGPVRAQRPVRARGVRAVENPVLPGRQAAEDLGLDRLGPGEPVVRLQPGQRVGTERRTLLDGDPHLLVPVDVVRGERDQAELLGLRRLQRLAGPLLRRSQS